MSIYCGSHYSTDLRSCYVLCALQAVNTSTKYSITVSIWQLKELMDLNSISTLIKSGTKNLLVITIIDTITLIPVTVTFKNLCFFLDFRK